MFAHQRHEGDRCQIVRVQLFAVTDQAHQFLIARRPDGGYQAGAFCQLGDERRRHLGGSRGYDDGIERSRFGPAVATVADAKVNVGVRWYTPLWQAD